MDIEEFYDSDPRRRASPEVEFGTDWHDQAGVRYELSWVQDTGELYVMREPVPALWEDPFGDYTVDSGSPHDETVSVVGSVPTHDQLEAVLAGWQDAMIQPDSVSWLVQRLKTAGVTPRQPDNPG